MFATMTAAQQPTGYEIAPAFRQAMRRLTSTVCIVSAQRDGRPVGMTMTAVASVSMEPPSLLICAKRSSSLHPALQPGALFCVNVLRVGQDAVAAAFGGGASHAERFGLGAWRMEKGVPYLGDALSSLFCTIDLAVDHGSHTVFIGAVREVLDGGEGAPLIYCDGRYGAN
jgi:flavin reductase (DIM6/NTAB) family NADH-FMN oxidoreductase RutF